MRKRLGIAALLFISIWTCAGCKSRTDDSENMETTTKSLAVSGLEVKPEEGVEIIKDASLFTIRMCMIRNPIRRHCFVMIPPVNMPIFRIAMHL